MAGPFLLPSTSAAIVDADRRMTRELRDFLRQLATQTDNVALAEELNQLAQRVSALESEDTPQATIKGLDSIRVLGSLESGFVQITLEGDADLPGNTYYYGTGPDGAKGFYAVADALVQGAGVTLTVAADGTIEIAHADTSAVADISANFTGGTVPGEISLTFDQFGHVLTRTITGRTLDHNDTGALQGGSATERYHFTAAEHAGLLPWVSESPADYALLTQTITNGDTTHAPSGDAVFDALAGKEPTIAAGTDGQLWRGDKAWSNALLWGGAALASPSVGLKLVSQNNTQAQLLEVITTDSGSGTVGPDICSTEYANSGGGGIFHMRRARGTLAAPAQVLAGDIIGGISGRAWHSGGAFQTSGPVSLHWVASEDQTSTNYGSYLRFYSTPKGTTTRAERLVLTDVGATWSLGAGSFDPKSATQTAPFGGSTLRYLASAVGETARFAAISYGSGGGGQLNLCAAGGTPAAPSAIGISVPVGLMTGIGYNGTSWLASALMRMQSTEAWTATASGSFYGFECTRTGTNTRYEVARFSGETNLLVNTIVEAHGGHGVIGIGNALNIPSSNPVGGGVLYVEGGALKYRGSSGTVTILAPA